MLVTRRTLIGRLQQGGSGADWDAFYLLYERPILAFATQSGLSTAEAEDVLQETMVKMCRTGLAKYDAARGRFTTWLFRIAKDCVIDARRRQIRWERKHEPAPAGRREEGTAKIERVADPSADVIRAAENRGRFAIMEEVLRHLLLCGTFKKRTVDIFKAVVLSGQDPQAVAQTFGTTRGNVYEARSAVLEKLRRVMERLEEGVGIDEAVMEKPSSR